MSDDTILPPAPPPPDAPQPPPPPNDIAPITIEEEMRRSYLDYAMSVIVARALPDARDGLKPVHRRILYSMYENNYTPDRPYNKSARVSNYLVMQGKTQKTVHDALAGDIAEGTTLATRVTMPGTTSAPAAAPQTSIPLMGPTRR